VTATSPVGIGMPAPAAIAFATCSSNCIGSACPFFG
jgi:hypothetical protein